jgi:hypothetical protein
MSAAGGWQAALMAALQVEARGIPLGRRRMELTTNKTSMKMPKQMAKGTRKISTEKGKKVGHDVSVEQILTC